MRGISMKVVAAVLAACLLVFTGLSGVAAWGPGNGGGGPGFGGFPGSSAKPLPSGWVWPSDDPGHVIKTHKPEPSKSPEATKPPKPTKPPITCPPLETPIASPSVAPATLTSLKESAFGPGKGFAWSMGIWNERINLLKAHIDTSFREFFCQPSPLLKTLDAQISGRIKTLQSWVKEINGSALSAGGKTTVDTELNGLISNLQVFKTKVDAETTLVALQADYQTLKGQAGMYGTVGLWVEEIVSSEQLIASESKLTTLESTIAADIAGAPAGPETADAQLFLNDMKLALTNGETLVAPLPAQLLAITPTQLSDGSAMPVLTGLKAQLSLAKWDFLLAQWTAKWAQMELKEAT